MPTFLRFTDRDGRRWKTYDFSILAGRTIYAQPGRDSAQYRGFVPEPSDDGRPRRRFMMFQPEDRVTDPARLQLELDLSTPDYRDNPTDPFYRKRQLPSGEAD